MKYLKLFELFNDENWYHGSDNIFTEFKEPNEMTRPTAVLGIWFTKDINFAENFGEHIIKVKLSYNKPYKISLEKWNEMRDNHAKDKIYFNNLRNNLIRKGYDSFYVIGADEKFGKYTVNTPDVIAIFHKNQIQII
jgi:hypothetical protein